MRDSINEKLRGLDHARGRPRLRVALGKLGCNGLLDLRVLVPEKDRTEAAHEIDVLVAVDVPYVCTLGALIELRVFSGQGVGAEMAVHAAGNHCPCPLAQRGVRRADAMLADDLCHVHAP